MAGRNPTGAGAKARTCRRTEVFMGRHYIEDTSVGVDFDFLPKGKTTVNAVTSDDGKGYGVKDITITYSE